MTVDSRRAAVLLALAIATAATHVDAQTPAPPAQRFEARAEAVLVDVAVLDGQGRPVTDLKPEDFRLEVEGSTRAIGSLQFIGTQPASSRRAAGNPREALTTTNANARSGRLILIAVDESHLRVGANRAVVRAAEGLLDRLAPEDLVALARLPDGVGGVEFTANRDLIRKALGAIVGKQLPLITSARVYLSEANEFVYGTRNGWPEVIRRECPPPDDQMYDSCVAAAEGSARRIVTDREQRTTQTVRFLEGLADRLRPLNAPINVVLISEGLFASPSGRAEIERLGAKAAAARLSLHIVRPARELYDIAERGAATDALQDDRLTRDGLEQLSGRMRGALFTATGAATGVFERISAELSGHYLLGFEPTAEDRNGRDRKIKVEVRRRGVTVRARASFAVRAAAPAPATRNEQLQQALLSPLPAPGVPIRVATYQAASGGAGLVRVLIGAEIGEPARDTATLPVALIVVDRSGKAVVTHMADAELKPALTASPSPRLFLTSVALAPGDYTLRLASAGADGAIGTVHHSFSARMLPVDGGLRFSDLIVTGAGGPEGSRPSPSAVVEGDRALILLEAEHAEAAALEGVKVTFDVASGPRDTPVLSAVAQSEARANGTQRAFASGVPLGALAPGEYVVRARVEVAGREAQVFERPFRVDGGGRSTSRPGAATAAIATPPAIVRPAPPAPARFMLPMLRFSVDDVLRPDIVNPFRTALKGQSEDVLRFFDDGVTALRRGQIPQATTLFQRTLRGAPDFVGVAFFMGAAHAAAGRDREAAGAWQMSLLSREAEPAYPFLVDALLRVGDGQRALDVIQRSPDAWKTSTSAREREILAEAVAGRFAQALPKIQALIASRPGDLDLLFVGIQMLYRQHLQEPLSGAPLTLFDAWTRQYQQAAGSDRPSIAPWRSYVVP